VLTVPLQSKDAIEMARMFKALADPVRLRLLSLVAAASATPEGECCVCDLTKSFDLTGPTISYHLKVLREAGLVESDRRGTWVYYRAVQQNFGRMSALLAIPGMPAVTG
jgi:ArsR family transcriptional regulator, arsenate/arsenite/antimonite-responsive transcriptional repressor